jgi:hypothetical protein
LVRLLGQTANTSDRDLIEQCIFAGSGSSRGYSGEAENPVLIRAADSGIEQSFQQLFAFGSGGGNLLYTVASVEDHPEQNLIDPISRSIRFQTDLFLATPYATTDQSQWA